MAIPSFALPRRVSTDGIGLLVAGLFLPLLLGLLIAIFPPLYIAVFVLGPVLVLLTWWKPLWVLFPYLCFSFFLPSYPVIDVVTAGLILLMYARCAFDSQLKEAFRQQPKSLYVVVTISLLAFVFGYLLRGNAITTVYRESRVFMYLAFAIPLVAFARKPGGGRQLLTILMAFALTIAVLSLLQSGLGVRWINTGRVADLNNLSTLNSDSVRVQIPGFPIVMFAIIFCFAIIASKPSTAIYMIPIGLVLGGGLIINYGRALWFWTAFGIFVCAPFFGRRGVILLALGVVFGVAALFIGDIFKPRLISTIVDRIYSTFNEGGGTTSFGWRQYEHSQGLLTLLRTFGAGVGLGGEYRLPLRTLSNWEDFTIYTHNTYLYIALKLSIAGLLAYIFLIRRIAVDALRTGRGGQDTAASFAMFSFLLAFAGLGVTQPELMTHYGTTFFAFLIAASVCLRIDAKAIAGTDTASSQLLSHSSQAT